jgi:hypothetical protein
LDDRRQSILPSDPPRPARYGEVLTIRGPVKEKPSVESRYFERVTSWSVPSSVTFGGSYGGGVDDVLVPDGGI